MQTIEITGIRNNKEITLTVEVKSNRNDGTPTWVRKVDGKPLYGTTGYIHKFNGIYSIDTYTDKNLLSEVKGLEVLEGFETITERNRDLWITVDGRSYSPEEYHSKFNNGERS